MPQSLIKTLEKMNLKLATAESCTGGLVATMITDISGVSSVFERGYITYSNASKNQCLGVSLDLIARHGAVSEQIARAMAEGALQYSNADVAISVTGIAGPNGGSNEKPVGLVYFGFAFKEKPTLTQKEIFAGDRASIRKAAAHFAIEKLKTLL